MIGRIDIRPPAPADPKIDAAADMALRKACAQFESVFMQELMKALRATVPEGMTSGGAGEEMFSGILDQHVAENAAARLERGIGAALYRQLLGSAGAP